MLIVPAGSILVFWTADGRSIDLLSLAAAPADQKGELDVAVLATVGDVEDGMVDLPSGAGLLHVPARLEQGRLSVRPPKQLRPLQRRQMPRSGLVLPLRGAADASPTGAGPVQAGRLVTFHGHTVDVGAGGLRARLTGDLEPRLPQQLRSVFVELAPDDPHSVAVALTVVSFRSDVLRARFSFISLADWARLQQRIRDQT